MLSRSLLILLSLASTQVAAKGDNRRQGKPVIEYTTVTGFFQQDDPATEAESFDYTTSNYGLIDRSYPTDSDLGRLSNKTLWQRFEHYVDTLNQDADDNTQYKVLFMGRHGEGYHNAAESYFGTPAWNCYWGPLPGNSTTTWRDAALTPAGIEQTAKASRFWTSQLLDEKMPAPEIYYSSPLQRCWATANLTFASVSQSSLLPPDRPFRPIIKELLREGISIRTCDERSSKTFIREQVSRYGFEFEEGFTEEDELWRGETEGRGETDEAQLFRTKVVLDDIFGDKKEEEGGGRKTWISITSHSGEIGKILEVLGHREFKLTTGQAIPVLVRAVTEREEEEKPTTTFASWTAERTCADGPPVTSLEVEDGCVCSGSSGSATVTPFPTASSMTIGGYPTITTSLPSL